jgi:hypothetical protein
MAASIGREIVVCAFIESIKNNNPAKKIPLIIINGR